MTDVVTTTPIYDGSRSVHSLVAEGAYKTQLPYPDRPREPAVLRKTAKELTAEELASITQVKADFAAAKDAYEVAIDAYRKDDGRLASQFQADLESEYGMTGHPKADKLWHKAYEDGHSGGLSEIGNVYSNLVDLVL